MPPIHQRKVIKDENGNLVLRRVTVEEHEKVKRFDHEPQKREQLDRQLNLVALATGKKDTRVLVNREMVPVRWLAPIDFQIGSEGCYFRLRMEAYQKCDHQCQYCFSQTYDGAQFYDENPGPDYWKDRLEAARSQFEKAFASSRPSKHDVTHFMRLRSPFHMSVVYDPFQEIREAKYGFGLSLLELLTEYEYPVMIQTKGDILLKRKYMDAVTELAEVADVAIQVSVCTHRNKKSKLIEPGAPPASRRFKTMKTYQEIGIPAIMRLSPFIKGFTSIKTVEYGLKKGLQYFSIRDFVAKKVMREKMRNAVGRDIVGSYMKKVKAYAGGLYYRPPSEVYEDFKPMVDLLTNANVSVGVGVPATLYLMGNTWNCCGIDEGAFSPDRSPMGTRRMSALMHQRFVKTGNPVMEWKDMKKICRREMKSQKIEDGLKLVWNKRLMDIAGIGIIDFDDNNMPIYASFPIELDPRLMPGAMIGRDEEIKDVKTRIKLQRKKGKQPRRKKKHGK